MIQTQLRVADNSSPPSVPYLWQDSIGNVWLRNNLAASGGRDICLHPGSLRFKPGVITSCVTPDRVAWKLRVLNIVEMQNK